jgi:hypothetical protein
MGSIRASSTTSIAKDRLAYLTEFLAAFFNTDVLLGKRVSDEVVRDSWNIAAGASSIGTWSCPPTWHTDFRDDLKQIDVPVPAPLEAPGHARHSEARSPMDAEGIDGR